MKVLLDENLPKRLKFRLLEQDYLTSTAREMGWNGKKNGELLGLLTFNGFDVLNYIRQKLNSLAKFREVQYYCRVAGYKSQSLSIHTTATGSYFSSIGRGVDRTVY